VLAILLGAQLDWHEGSIVHKNCEGLRPLHVHFGREPFNLSKEVGNDAFPCHLGLLELLEIIPKINDLVPQEPLGVVLVSDHLLKLTSSFILAQFLLRGQSSLSKLPLQLITSQARLSSHLSISDVSSINKINELLHICCILEVDEGISSRESILVSGDHDLVYRRKLFAQLLDLTQMGVVGQVHQVHSPCEEGGLIPRSNLPLLDEGLDRTDQVINCPVVKDLNSLLDSGPFLKGDEGLAGVESQVVLDEVDPLDGAGHRESSLDLGLIPIRRQILNDDLVSC